MTRKELISFYTSRKDNFSEQLRKITSQINLISNTRLITALIFAVVLYYTFSNVSLLYPLLIILVGFILLIRKHGKLFEQKVHLENLIKVHANELKLLAGDTAQFDSGSKFIDPHHPYSHDLDIFGEGSLFQFINRCNTLDGNKKFAARLSHPLSSQQEIIIQQEAIRELKTKHDFRHHFQAAGMEIDELSHDRDQLLSWVKQPPFIYGKNIYRIILVLVPVITIGLVIGTFFMSALKPFAILAAGFQWAFLSAHLKKISLFHDYISRKKNILKKYSRLLHELQKEKFTSTAMQSLLDNAGEADRKVRTLASWTSALDARLNSFTFLIVNSLFLYDLQCVYYLEKWKEENAVKLQSWLNAISEAEILCSFASFAFNHLQFVNASINNEFTIAAKDLGHPLIGQEERITNDLMIGNDQKVLIVTGANMAGKSTFLRTLGVNIILALNGAPVCAKEFSCPLINLRTGMRTADSLKDHQSYFYAELDRLKTIMSDLRSDKPLLILLDEILKGTNSTDKQTGSIALVKQLLPHPCLAVIATHDLALGELEKEYSGQVKNFCFEATIENDQLSFDYKLKRGLAQKMNATFLMKKMGIIPS